MQPVVYAARKAGQQPYSHGAEAVGSNRKSEQWMDHRSSKMKDIIDKRTRELANHTFQEGHEIASGPPWVIPLRVHLDCPEGFGFLGGVSESRRSGQES